MMVILWGLRSREREREKESRVFAACPASYLSIQTLFTLIPTTVNLLHPAASWSSAACEWVKQSHLPANPSLLSVSHQAIVIPKWFSDQRCAASPLQTLHIITLSSLSNAFPPMSPWYFTDSSYSSTINRMAHRTNTKLDSHYTSLYSCHHTECNTAQMHIANGY